MDETSDSMRVGDVVLVNNDKGAETDGDVDIFSQWKAHVLEIRAPDAQHVYLRVLWVYDPEELPGGRRSYHGENELVPSNDMAIIDAMTINGLVSLKKWNEYDDDDDPDTGTDEAPGFYWRQTYDVNKRQLSVSLAWLTLTILYSDQCVYQSATSKALHLQFTCQPRQSARPVYQQSHLRPLAPQRMHQN